MTKKQQDQADQVDRQADQAGSQFAPPTLGDAFPLSKRATPEQVMAAGICNGMSAQECEARLAKVMS